MRADSTHFVQLCDLFSGTGGAIFQIPYSWAAALSGDGAMLALSPKEERDLNRVELFSVRDGLHLRNAGIPTYGVSALGQDPDDYRAHGRDERIRVADFYRSVEYWYRLLRAL